MTKPVLIAGFGESGQGAAKLFKKLGFYSIAFEDNPNKEHEKAAKRLDVKYYAAPGLETLKLLVEQSERIVVSPGLRPSHPIFSLSSEKEIISELELGYQYAGVDIIAVTGTNAKTTVVYLISKMLSKSGVKTIACGNYGKSLCEVISLDAGYKVLVVEASSFQLQNIKSFCPKIAVFTNFSPDHLDWHGGIDNYFSAKMNIFNNQSKDNYAIINYDDEKIIGSRDMIKSEIITFGVTGGDFRVENDKLIAKSGEEIIDNGQLYRHFKMDLLNYLAASAASIYSNASLDAVRSALADFKPLPHRMQDCGIIEGVRYINDSKSTTPASTLAALKELKSVILLAGGRNKGLDLSVLAEAKQNLKAVIAFGEAAGELSEIFGNADVRVTIAKDMREAVNLAKIIAAAGDTVLLSPACTSFDMYRSYEDRGRDYMDALESAKRVL
jgi:UDP-N-acetylmuramoylalanine--D-glutamate ligase